MSDDKTNATKLRQDSRIPCRYGDKCYQKNPSHLAKYKHPPRNGKRKHSMKHKMDKKVKLDEEKAQTSNNPSEEETSEECVMQNKEASNEAQKESISSSDSEENYVKDIVSVDQKAKTETISSSDSEENYVEDSTNVDQKAKKESISSSDSEPNDAEDKSSNVQKDAPPFVVATNVSETSKAEEKDKSENPQKKFSNESFNPKKFIKSRFLVSVPDDFYTFWDFCKQLKPTAPNEALKDIGLELVGPYDVLAGKFKHSKKSPEEYLRHWRYYYDPPEVLTIIKGDNNTGYHIGYFYDSPDEPPVFLVSNHGIKDGVFTKMGDNIFAAVSLYLDELKKTGDPFKKMRIGKFLTSIKNEAEKLNLNLSAHSKQIKERGFKVVTKTFNNIGLVVPYNKKTQLGYRDLAMQDKDLMTLLNKLEKASPEQKSKFLSDLQPVLTYANIALDECDFGTGIKLGWELLYHGIDSLNSTISQFLSNSYRLLNKEVYAKIAEAHMNKRKKSCDLSII